MFQKIIYLSAVMLLFSCHDNKTTDSGDIPDNVLDSNGEIIRQIRAKDSLIIGLQTMKATSLDCTAEAFWHIVQRGRASVPMLIEHLSDTSMTQVFDRCKGGYLNIGEICYFALDEIMDLPIMLITHIQFDLIEGGCWSFYRYLFDNKNKSNFKTSVRYFYETYKNSGYSFVKYSGEDIRACHEKYKIEGRLEWKDPF